MIDTSKYHDIEIPGELPSVVSDAIREGQAARRRSLRLAPLKKAAHAAAVLVLCTVALLNLSPSFASAACRIPLIGEVCRVFTFREYHREDEIKYVDVKLPQIENTSKTELEKRVNLEIQKIISERVAENEARAKDYYDAYVATGGNPEEFTPVGITVDYEVKYVDADYVSFVISQYETRFSAYHYFYYYNIDIESGRILTLRDWLGDDYRQIAAGSIEETIAGWDEERKALLWEDLSVIDLISENTNFYLNADGDAVVVFDKYEAAVGTAGVLEFPIQQPER